MDRHRDRWSRVAAGLVIGFGALLLLLIVGNFTNVVSFSSQCSPNDFSCEGIGGTQPWWGLSTTDATWYSGDPNYLTLLFVAAAIASIAWGGAAMRTNWNRTPLVIAGTAVSALVVGSLVVNLVRLSQFTSYWIHWSCLVATCSSVSTHYENGVTYTIVLIVLLFASIVLACGLYNKRVPVEELHDVATTDDLGVDFVH